MSKHRIIFIIACLLLGGVTNLTLFEEKIGISYTIFIIVFYSFFFYRLRKFPFTHKQMSAMLFLIICILSITFFIYSNPVFYMLNYMIIPALVIIHTVMVTSSASVSWYNATFLTLLGKKVKQFFKYGTLLTKVTHQKFKRNIDESTYRTSKKIGIGLLIALPLVFVILILLLSADSQFANLIYSIPQFFTNIKADLFWTIGKIGFLTLFFYSYFKVVTKKTVTEPLQYTNDNKNWDTIIMTTILVSLNLIYLLFTIVQFQYFFSGSLEADVSYAQYARRGFAELLVVTVINYLMLLLTVRKTNKDPSQLIKVQLTLLIVFSSVMLISSYMRLMMYEQAFGFTHLRIFAHAFMIHLMIILVFTLVKVCAPRLPMVRFYIIFTLLFYVGFNVIGIDKIIVKNNIERYENTEKIDVHYLNELSYSAIPEMVELYKKHPDIPDLENMLINKKDVLNNRRESWQSYNLSHVKAKNSINKLNLP